MTAYATQFLSFINPGGNKKNKIEKEKMKKKKKRKRQEEKTKQIQKRNTVLHARKSQYQCATEASPPFAETSSPFSSGSPPNTLAILSVGTNGRYEGAVYPLSAV